EETEGERGAVVAPQPPATGGSVREVHVPGEAEDQQDVGRHEAGDGEQGPWRSVRCRNEAVDHRRERIGQRHEQAWMREPPRDRAAGNGRAEGPSMLARNAGLHQGRQKDQRAVDQLARGYGVHSAPAPASGRSTSNVIPPSGLIAAVIRPPCASSVRLAIASPSPVPFALSEKKGSKRRGI